MNTQQMLDEIYEKYADKTLSFGCKIGRYESEHDKELKRSTCIKKYDPDEHASMYSIDTLKGIRIDSESDLISIGHPISLARVLSVLGDTYFFDKRIFQKIERDDNGYVINTGYICNRKLLNDDGRDAILEDQSDETIKAIYNILFPTT